MNRRDAVKGIVAGLVMLPAYKSLYTPRPKQLQVYDQKNEEFVPVGTSVKTTSNQLIPKTIESGIYFTPSALLHVTVWNSVTAQSLTFQCWYLDPQGNLKHVPFNNETSGALSDMTAIPATRAARKQLVNMPISGGTIVSFTVRCGLGTFTSRGQTLVKASIDNVLNGSDNTSTTQVIVYGYVYSRKDLCYPAIDSIQDPTSGQGFLNSVVSTPAPGAEISFAPPTNTRWKYLGLQFQLITDATVTNRTTIFSLADSSGNTFYVSPVSPAMTASNTWTFYIVPAYYINLEAAFDANTNIRGFMPEFMVTAASSVIITLTTNIKSTDQWTLTAFVEEWIEPAS